MVVPKKDCIMIVVNMTNGKLDESEELLACTKDGSLARMGAKMEKKPKFIACENTVMFICSQYSSVKVSK